MLSIQGFGRRDFAYWVILHVSLSSVVSFFFLLFFFCLIKNNFFVKFFQEYHQSVKQF